MKGYFKGDINFVNFSQTSVEMLPPQTGLRACLWDGFSIGDECGRVQPPVIPATPGQVDLCLEEAGWGSTSKQRSSMVSVSVTASRFLPRAPALASLSEGL